MLIGLALVAQSAVAWDGARMPGAASALAPRTVAATAQLQRVIGHTSSQAHRVLAYYASPNAEPLILDNLVSRVATGSQRPDLTPVFSFNGEGLWQGVGERTAGNPLERLSRWRDVLVKMSAQGFL